jgi:hypothetical protein
VHPGCVKTAENAVLMTSFIILAQSLIMGLLGRNHGFDGKRALWNLLIWNYANFSDGKTGTASTA